MLCNSCCKVLLVAVIATPDTRVCSSLSQLSSFPGDIGILLAMLTDYLHCLMHAEHLGPCMPLSLSQIRAKLTAHAECTGAKKAESSYGAPPVSAKGRQSSFGRYAATQQALCSVGKYLYACFE